MLPENDGMSSFLGGFWVSWPQQCWGCGRDTPAAWNDCLPVESPCLVGEIQLLTGWWSWPLIKDSQDSGYLHLVLPRSLAKVRNSHSFSWWREAERERETHFVHIFSEALPYSLFCPALSGQQCFCLVNITFFWLLSSLGWYLGALLPKALSTSTSFRCGSQKPAREMGKNSLPNRWTCLGCGVQHCASVPHGFQDLPSVDLIGRWSTRNG